MITEKLPVEVELKMPDDVERGKSIEIGVNVKGDKGVELAGVAPVEVRVEDPAFRAAEPSGYYAAERGRSVVKWDVAENDRIGMWKITVKELMTGVSRTKWLKVK